MSYPCCCVRRVADCCNCLIDWWSGEQVAEKLPVLNSS